MSEEVKAAEAGEKDTPEQAEFRAHCRDWLENNHPGEPPVELPQGALELSDPAALEWLQAWQKSAYDAGLVGSDYPTEVGGGGRQDCQRIANAEMQAAKTPFFPNIIGLGMAAPTVLFHGTDSVKQELLPRLLSGEDIWCQGFSEPGAGSDLANQQTFARRDGDNWVINGHKVWTSLAHFASWMILLCRTDKDDKYNGLSYFVVPINSKLGDGVTVRPLIKMTGETGFNEVLFDDLVVPDEYRLDEVGAGWKVAMTTLAHERGAGPLVTPSAGGMVKKESKVSTGSPSSLIALAKQQPRNGKTAADDPVLRDEIMKMVVRRRAMQQNQRRARVSALTDHPQRIPLQSKLVSTEFNQDLAEIAYQIQGNASSLSVADPNAPDGGQWQHSYMNSERVLGMPKSK
jgi:alkylation response protein AidB-like acyl-CoA dehydrogenase